MKKNAVRVLIVLLLISTSGFAQTRLNRYEVEILANPNAGKKDTREVNAVLIFEKDSIKIQSRRNNEIFKEFKYPEVTSVEHSYSKKPFLSTSMATAIALTALTGLPIFLFAIKKDKHWLTIVSGDDFAVLKVENDNYRLLRNEFIVRKVKLVDIDEGKH